MLNDSVRALSRVALSDLGAVRVQGADAVKFLQGQLSHDIGLLSPSRSLLAGLHNPQGRVIALLRLMAMGDGELLAILPRELAAPVATRLAKYVLRAKVKVADVSSEWQLFGVTSLGDAGGQPSVPAGAARRDEEAHSSMLPDRERQAGHSMSPGGAGERSSVPADAARRHGEASPLLASLGGSPARWLEAVSNAHAPATDAPLSARASAETESGQLPAEPQAVSRRHWHLQDIANGIPHVYASTSEQFVAQMLNLDVLDAISFTKGCYTGQEVIARAHYRGRVKRRMQRFRTTSAALLAPNETGTLRDGRNFRVVDAVQLDDGRCEFLAVAPTSAGDKEASEAPTTAPAEAAVIEAEALPLPYALPA